MHTYQIFVIGFFAYTFLSLIVTELIVRGIKKRKAKKQAFADLVYENRQLKNEVYSLKFRAKLRGDSLDV